jgi:uncharacterized membrane protein (UPF0127 family)
MTPQFTTQIQILKGNQVIADQCNVGVRFFERLRGLIGKSPVEISAGMLLPDCNDVHMWWMSTSIDIVFLKRMDDTTWKVLRIFSSVKPWRLLPIWIREANDTLELSAGTCIRLGIGEGDLLQWSNLS